MSNQTIIKYIRNRKGELRGVVVATKTGEQQYNVGWSLCNRREDTFDKKFGVEIATRRAKVGSCRANIPHSVRKTYCDMIHRAHKYFKGCHPKNTTR